MSFDWEQSFLKQFVFQLDKLSFSSNTLFFDFSINSVYRSINSVYQFMTHLADAQIWKKNIYMLGPQEKLPQVSSISRPSHVVQANHIIDWEKQKFSTVTWIILKKTPRIYRSPQKGGHGNQKRRGHLYARSCLWFTA